MQKRENPNPLLPLPFPLIQVLPRHLPGAPILVPWTPPTIWYIMSFYLPFLSTALESAAPYWPARQAQQLECHSPRPLTRCRPNPA